MLRISSIAYCLCPLLIWLDWSSALFSISNRFVSNLAHFLTFMLFRREVIMLFAFKQDKPCIDTVEYMEVSENCLMNSFQLFVFHYKNIYVCV